MQIHSSNHCIFPDSGIQSDVIQALERRVPNHFLSSLSSNSFVHFISKIRKNVKKHLMVSMKALVLLCKMCMKRKNTTVDFRQHDQSHSFASNSRWLLWPNQSELFILQKFSYYNNLSIFILFCTYLAICEQLARMKVRKVQYFFWDPSLLSHILSVYNFWNHQMVVCVI